MSGEELPQLLGGEVGPMVAAAVDGDQHHAAVVGTSGGRGGDRPAGRDGRRLTLIDLTPERIQVRYRRAVDVDEATAGPATIGNQRIYRAVNRHDRRRMRGPARGELCPRN